MTKHTHKWDKIGGSSPWSHCMGCDKWRLTEALRQQVKGDSQ